jgi:hypothetical protein
MTDLQTKTVCFVPHKKGDIEPDNVLHDSLDNAVKHRFSVIPANDGRKSIIRSHQWSQHTKAFCWRRIANNQIKIFR